MPDKPLSKAAVGTLVTVAVIVLLVAAAAVVWARRQSGSFREMFSVGGAGRRGEGLIQRDLGPVSHIESVMLPHFQLIIRCCILRRAVTLTLCLLRHPAKTRRWTIQPALRRSHLPNIRPLLPIAIPLLGLPQPNFLLLDAQH
jgi:hypothetical protein